MGTWNAYGNEDWPADYLIDASGQVRYATFGEGDYDKTETAIRALLAEAGHNVAAGHSPPDRCDRAQPRKPRRRPISGPRAGRAGSTAPSPALTTTVPATPGPCRSTTSPSAAPGTWPPSPSRPSPPPGSTCEFEAKHVYLVLSSAGNVPRTVQVLLDGRPISAADAGSDVHDGLVTVKGERLYTLVSLPHDEQRRLSLRFAPGVTGYAFTFG